MNRIRAPIKIDTNIVIGFWVIGFCWGVQVTLVGTIRVTNEIGGIFELAGSSDGRCCDDVPKNNYLYVNKKIQI